VFAKLSYVEAQRQVALTAGRAYLTIIGQRRLLQSSIHARNTAKVHEDFSKSRLQGGVGNRLDWVRASQDRATAETRVQAQLIALVKAQEALGIAIGENGPLDAEGAELAAPPTLDAALKDTEQRSDVVASRERVESARKAVRDSYAEYLPVLSGVATPFYQNPSSLTLPTTGWQAQLLLTLPIFDGGNRYGLRHERDALYEQSKTKLDAALRQARSEVRVAFESVQRADDALAQAREAAKLAAEALDLSQLAYRAGATSNIEVVDAQRRARDAESDAAVAEDGARQARLDLLSAAGKFP
jgi:outer membrane protein TolC